MVFCREEPGISGHANENLETPDGDSSLEHGLNQWKVQVAAALRGGTGELRSMILKVLLVLFYILIILLFMCLFNLVFNFRVAECLRWAKYMSW